MLRFAVAALLVCAALGDSLHPVRRDLTEKEVHLIKDTWPMVSKAEEWAVDLALKYFKAHPEVQTGNPKLKGVAYADLKTNPEFRHYAMKMYEFFDIGVRYVHAGPVKGRCKPLEDRSEAYVKMGATDRRPFVDYRDMVIDHLAVKGDHLTAWNQFMDNILALIFSKFP